MKSKLPEGGKPLAFILYSDKTKLSTFGSAKAYPIVARLANLPVEIRNSNNTMGGGQVVGWLPIVCFSFINTHQLETQLYTTRSKRVKRTDISLALSISRMLFGMKPFTSSLKVLSPIPEQAFGSNALMMLYAFYSPLFSSYLQTMKNSRFVEY